MEHSNKASFIRNKTERTDIRHRLLKGLSMSLLLLLIAMVPVTMAYLQKVTSPVSNAFAAAQKYTLTYHENDGAQPNSVTDMPDPKADIVSYTGEFDIASDVPKREGYRFKGWNTDAGGEGDMVEPSTASQTTTYKVTGNATRVDLYAIWEPDRYQLIYDPNGGSIEGVLEETTPCSAGNEVHYTDLYPVLKSAHFLEVKFEKGIADSIDVRDNSNRSAELHQNELSYTWDRQKIYAMASKSGYTFLGWSTDPDASDPQYTTLYHKIDQPITASITEHDIDACTEAAVHTALVLYPVFEKTYTLNYSANTGGSNAPAKQTATVRKPDLTGSYTFDIYDDVTNNNPPKRQQYRFMGWSTTQNGSAEYGYQNTTNNELGRLTRNLKNQIELTDAKDNITLYAVWWREYRFTFDANGGTGAPGDTYKYSTAATDTITVPQDIPTYTDLTGKTFTFLGWSTDPKAEEAQYVVPAPGTPDDQLQDNEKITLRCGNTGSAEITLYAVWQKSDD